jgi:hypothetical protein
VTLIFGSGMNCTLPCEIIEGLDDKGTENFNLNRSPRISAKRLIGSCEKVQRINLYYQGQSRREAEHKLEHNNCRMRPHEPDIETPSPT